MIRQMHLGVKSLLGVFVLAGALAARGAEPTVPGVTQPVRMEYSKLTLHATGIVDQVAVKPGDHVKKGTVLVHLNEDTQRVDVKKAQAEANSTAKVDEAIANLETKKVILARKEQTFKNNALSQSELDEARLDVIDAEARLKVSKVDLEKAKCDAEGAQILLTRMSLTSPFDGVVESLDTSVGEVIDPNRAERPICTVVQTSPLWVEIKNMPANWAQRLKIGDNLEVRYDDRYAGTPIYDGQWVKAQVVYRAPVADPGSDTQMVRLAMENPKGIDAGLQVVVRLPQAVTATADAGSAVKP
jgi:RND family efflux transporter MFP subunit